MPNDKLHGPTPSISTEELLTELARRFALRFGSIEAVFHEGKPSPRVLVQHRIQHEVAKT